MGPQPNNGCVPHLDCTEEITTSISQFIHRCHRPSLVSVWLCLTVAEIYDTLGFRDTHTMQGQTAKGSLTRALLFRLHRVDTQHIFGTSRKFILGSLAHGHTQCCSCLSFRALISHFLMWRGHWSIHQCGEALYDSHLSALGRPRIDLYKVSVMFIL